MPFEENQEREYMLKICENCKKPYPTNRSKAMKIERILQKDKSNIYLNQKCVSIERVIDNIGGG